MSEKLTNLETLLDLISEADEGSNRVSLGGVLNTVGRRSFGALLLALGLIPFSPLSAVLGVSTTIAVLVLLIAGQFLLGRSHFWLPRWLLRRSVSRAKFKRALRFLHPVARSVDRLIRPRWTVLTESAALYAIAAVSIIIALIMPPLEMLPLANHIAGAALTAFGLGLIAHDGLLVIIALIFCLAGIVLLASALF